MTIAKTSEMPEEFPIEKYEQNPPKAKEWLEGKLVDKKPIQNGVSAPAYSGITLEQGEIQGNLYFYLRNFLISSGQGGKAYLNAPCRTRKQGYRPDVAYLPPEMVQQYCQAKILPYSFPWVAEIATPADPADEIFLRGREYLEAGSQEVWFLLPASQWIVIMTENRMHGFTAGQIVNTQAVLPGFAVQVRSLFEAYSA